MAVPVTAEKESKITSTLRRLSVVRRKSKNKMRPNKADAKGIEEEPNAEGTGGNPTAASASSEAAAGSARPSSTTSRDSENDVVTSGYFRLKIR